MARGRGKRPIPPPADLSQHLIKTIIPAFAIAGAFFTIRYVLHKTGHHKEEKML